VLKVGLAREVVLQFDPSKEVDCHNREDIEKEDHESGHTAEGHKGRDAGLKDNPDLLEGLDVPEEPLHTQDPDGVDGTAQLAAASERGDLCEHGDYNDETVETIPVVSEVKTEALSCNLEDKLQDEDDREDVT